MDDDLWFVGISADEKEELHEMVEEALEENAEALDKGKVPDETDSQGKEGPPDCFPVNGTGFSTC